MKRSSSPTLWSNFHEKRKNVSFAPTVDFISSRISASASGSYSSDDDFPENKEQQDQQEDQQLKGSGKDVTEDSDSEIDTFNSEKGLGKFQFDKFDNDEEIFSSSTSGFSRFGFGTKPDVQKMTRPRVDDESEKQQTEKSPRIASRTFSFTQVLILLGLVLIIALIICALCIRRENSEISKLQTQDQTQLSKPSQPPPEIETTQTKIPSQKSVERKKNLELFASLGDFEAEQELTQSLKTEPEQETPSNPSQE
jgi:hypothetical protein